MILLPKLRKVKLRLISGGTSKLDASFIENHSSIGELSWHPNRDSEASERLLPNLNHLRSAVRVMKGLLESGARLELEEESEDVVILIPPAASLSVGSVKVNKRSSVVRAADEPEEEAATPLASLPAALLEEYEVPAQYARRPRLRPRPCYHFHPQQSASLPHLPRPHHPTLNNRTSTVALRARMSRGSPSRPCSLIALPTMDRNTPQKISAYAFAELQDLRDLTDMFPNIRRPSLPAAHLPSVSPNFVPFYHTRFAGKFAEVQAAGAV